MAAALIHIQGKSSGVKVIVDRPRLTIGRSADNDLGVEDELVSKQHAVIEAVSQGDDAASTEFYVQDLDSTNHTFVNERQVSLHRLAHDDIIRVGKTQFRFVLDAKVEFGDTVQMKKTWIPGVYVTKKSPGKKR
jgi:pSer/pThr/pTyr-binding forkhead associated (FHA) protein